MKTHVLPDRELQEEKEEKTHSDTDKKVISEIGTFDEADWEREVEEIQIYLEPFLRVSSF